MKRVLVIQHESYEALGVWGPILKSLGVRLRYVNFERDPDLAPSIKGYDGVILLGGYMGVYESESYAHLKEEFKLIEEALKSELPVFGICLGAQILASVLGANVRPHSSREMGWYDIEMTEAGLVDPVTGHFRAREKVFQSHGDTFDIPQGAIHLARSETCEAQAFRYGENAYGLQFHLEVTRPIIDDWFEMPMNQGKFSPELVRVDTDRHLDRSLELSEELLKRYFYLVGAKSRPIRLGSGHGKPGSRGYE